jgi:S-adenosylmethionine-diacylglycerol 3-amino-3-carboxypropyl transferase
MQAASIFLKNVANQERIVSHSRLARKVFRWWFNSLAYNQTWEDPQVDLVALQPDSHSRILTIASGGCNVLNYLTAKPAAIIAVDLNPAHLYLTRLKLTALQYLPDYESFFRFFGEADHPANIPNYHGYIRPYLDLPSRAYWDGRTLLGQPRIHYFAKNFYRHAGSGYFLRFLHALGRINRVNCERLLQAQTQEQQEQIFEAEIAPLFDKKLARSLSNLLLRLIISPQQCDAMQAEAGGQLVDLYRERVKRLACGFPMQDNYFAWQAFGLRYDQAKRQAVPEYLKEQNYNAIRHHSRRVETYAMPLLDYLQQQPDNSLDGFVLQDAQDRMRPAVIARLWQEITRAGKPGSRIVFRAAASASPIETALPARLRARFTYLDEESRFFHQKDRSAIYGGFHLYALD